MWVGVCIVFIQKDDGSFILRVCILQSECVQLFYSVLSGARNFWGLDKQIDASTNASAMHSTAAFFVVLTSKLVSLNSL